MIASRMPALDPVCLVIAQAGNVNSGAFDPFEPICDQTRKADAWLHIDGAFGLWAAAYLVGGQGRDGMHYAPEMSRRARTVDLWATIKSLGRSGIEALIDGLCAHARHFARLLQAQSFRILNEVVFNQVLFSCSTAEQTRATLEHIQKSGKCWCGGTLWRGEPAIRISVCSWATTSEDVQRTVAAFATAREKAVSAAAGEPAARQSPR
jgi:glutamate/tyrosine decarboxylase-like PLP-dependent enzyme